MAASSSAVTGTGTYHKAWTVTATLDADVGVTIAHGLADVTDGNTVVVLTPIDGLPARKSLWAKVSLDATNLILGKSTAAGSGDASAQLRVDVIKLHTIVQ